MAKNGFFMVLFMMVFASSVMVNNNCAVAQTVHVVGDSLGWNVPSTADAYDNWADTKIFRVGDILLFNFVTGSHNLVEVTEASYDACTDTNTIGTTITTGPANVTLTSVGEHYYICTVGTHCTRGQKLDITVTAAAPSQPMSPPPPSQTPPKADAPTSQSPPMNGPASPTTPAAPTPPAGSSSSVVLAGVMGTILSVAVGLFF